MRGFPNAYFVSSEGSNVNFAEYLDFCRKANLKTDEIDLDDFKPSLRNVSGGIYTDEVVYDSRILKYLVSSDLDRNNVAVLFDSNVSSVEESIDGFVLKADNVTINARSIVNCTYSSFNSFNESLGVSLTDLQYELTVVPIVKWRSEKPPVGITVMDGRFFTILPFGKSGQYLLYHVDHTVRDTFIGRNYPKKWKSPREAIGDDAARDAYEQMVRSSSHWLPDISSAEYIDFLATVRVVLAGVDSTDRRPSLIEKLETKHPFYTVFSGKIDHSIWVASDLAGRLMQELNE
ncbi:hypothetical protein [Breoghania sp. L-A4]|uniref:hypothetical protein n=1 Tax=Breoghania sp. L-A4 TaxID=2304600 RepID=UPI0013C320ED|nr:hypothetical protein [Breoghania sp. L-A4]